MRRYFTYILWMVCCGCSPVSAQVILNEIMYHVPDQRLEYIELWNTGNSAMDVGGWQIRDSMDSHEFTLPLGTSIQPGGFLVIVNDPLFFSDR